MTKNILYISYDGMTDPLGQSQVLPYICGLSKRGYSFTLISCEKLNRYESNKADIEKICSENGIDWRPLIYHKSPPILSTVWDVNQMQKLAYRLEEEKSFSIVHCRGYISALIGLGLKRRYGTKFLFDMRGLWADEKVDAGAWRLDHPVYNWVYKFFKKKEREFFTHADQTVSLSERGKKEIQSWDYMRGIADNITVIPCCADMDLFDYHSINDEDKNDWKIRLGIKDNYFILSYLGSIGTWYMLEEMLDFFVVLRTKYSNAKFLFITHDEHDRIRTEAVKRRIEQHIIIRPASRDNVPRLLSLSNLSLFFIRPTYSKLASSPTKQAEIMAMGIPLICNAGVGDTDVLVKKYEAGYVLSKLTVEDYSLILNKIDLSQFDKSKLRAGALDYASLIGGVRSYAAIYEKLCADVG
ncbi:MAG: glycosyltransferase [Chitinophagales bacterium]|jgi:glycosyltransferase involved in cell wall biosynthesis|nr:glycosyltransferase [Sphingobacteriales bacterium]